MSGKFDAKTVATAFVIGIPVGLVFGLMISILTGNYTYIWALGIPLGIIFSIIMAVPMVKGKNKSSREMADDEDEKNYQDDTMRQ